VCRARLLAVQPDLTRYLRIAADSPKPKAEHALPPRASIISGDIWNCCSAGTEQSVHEAVLRLGCWRVNISVSASWARCSAPRQWSRASAWHSVRWRVAGYLTPSMPIAGCISARRAWRSARWRWLSPFRRFRCARAMRCRRPEQKPGNEDAGLRSLFSMRSM
jgi:hypothetical protein